jgi:hypothetical protein
MTQGLANKVYLSGDFLEEGTGLGFSFTFSRHLCSYRSPFTRALHSCPNYDFKNLIWTASERAFQ